MKRLMTLSLMAMMLLMFAAVSLADTKDKKAGEDDGDKVVLFKITGMM